MGNKYSKLNDFNPVFINSMVVTEILILLSLMEFKMLNE